MATPQPTRTYPGKLDQTKAGRARRRAALRAAGNFYRLLHRPLADRAPAQARRTA